MSDICRLCGEDKPLEDLSCIADDDSTVAFKLESCLKIKLDCDKLLPQSSCFTCINTLDVAFLFVEQVLSVQEKLKNDLQDKLSLITFNINLNHDLDEYNKFELKLERLDSSLHEFLSSDELLIERKSTTTCTQSKSRKRAQPPKEKKIFKKNIEWEDEELLIRPSFWKRHKNFGLKEPKKVIRYSMNDLFKKEMKGKFTVPSKEMEIEDEGRMPHGKLSCRAKERLAPIGWFNYEWKCHECAETFLNVFDIEKHSIKVHKKRSVNRCEPCHRIYKNYASFLNHVTITHQPLLKYSCTICSEFHTSFLHLHKHIAQAHPGYNIYICLYCGEFQFTGALMKNHIADKHIPVAKIFSCDLCPKTFDRKQRTLIHMKMCHLAKSFICELCASSFLSQADLLEHQKAVHINLYDEKCPFCERAFKNRRSLRRHVKHIHEDTDLKIPCENCSHVSTSKRQHNAHKRRHSDKLRFKCKYCNRAFKYHSGYKYHTRIHTGERLYMCPVEGCGKRDVDGANSKKHTKTAHGLMHLTPIRLPKGSNTSLDP